MKYIILLLIGVLSVSVLPLDKINNQANENNRTESVNSTSVEALGTPEESKTAIVPSETPKAPTFAELSLEEKIKANPNKCDLNVQVMHEDGSCHNKPVANSTSATPNATVTSSGDCSLVYNYSNWNQRVAYAVCMAESSNDPNNENMKDIHRYADGSVRCVGSFGLMQLACFWIPNPKDPVANMAKANEIYSRSGWSPWGAYTSGKYLKYL